MFSLEEGRADICIVAVYMQAALQPISTPAAPSVLFLS